MSAVPFTYDDIAKMLDHSLLQPTLTDADMEAGCRVAREYQVASVCIKPYAVWQAAQWLAGSGVVVGTSADRGERARSAAKERARAPRLGVAELIARALSIVAWILARFRMIERSCTSRSTSRPVIATTLSTSKPWNARMKASRLLNTTLQLRPTWNTPNVNASNSADWR